MRSSAVINRSRGAMTLSLTPSRSSMGFQVEYCSGNSRCTVMISSPRFHSRPYATTAAPALAPRDRDFLGFSSNHFRKSLSDSHWCLKLHAFVHPMWKLLRFERMLDRADRNARHHRMCCRVQVGCVFNFEPFLLQPAVAKPLSLCITISLKNNFTSHFSAQNFSDLIPVHSGLVLTRAVTDYFLGHCFKRVRLIADVASISRHVF